MRLGAFRETAVLLAVAAFWGCGIPKDALQMHPQTLQQRRMQTCLFDTQDEVMILSACMALLQDCGYMLESSETDLGLIVASKDRSATDAGEEIWDVFWASIWGTSPPAASRDQKIRVSVVAAPHGETGERIAVRVTFQRTVWNTDNQICEREALNDPELYQEFFDTLSKAVFLEAHQI